MIKIFADINCPFCFAQHERLQNLPVCDQVEWRYVEHAPSILTKANTPEQLELLAQEVTLVTQRAPEVEINLPGFCVNTQLAITSLLITEQLYPERAQAYRSSLYRAYWQDGKDISSMEVLQELLRQSDLPWTDSTERIVALQHNYQQEWQSGDFDLRIPAMQSEDNRIALGLQNSYNIENFFQQGSSLSGEQGPVCDYRSDYRVALLGGHVFRQRIISQTGTMMVSAFPNAEAFLEHGQPQQYDCILLDFLETSAKRSRQLNTLQEFKMTVLDFPVICVDTSYDAGREAMAFSLGAADYITLSSDSQGTLARIKQQINTFRAIRVLAEHANIDGLTGLLNRRSFEHQIECEWRQGCRTQSPLALVMLDCDYFKGFNDTYGHCAGDDCLRLIAQTITRELHRPGDIAVRYGGEEFVVLLPDTDLDGAVLVAERIRGAIESLKIPHEAGLTGGYVTMSAGVVCAVPHADQTPLQLLEKADAALYQSKEAGRNRVSAHSLEYPDYAAAG